jgi:hypothetical protein
MHNREQTMKRFVFLAGVLTLGFGAATPARADYALLRWTGRHLPDLVASRRQSMGSRLGEARS